MVDQGSPEWKAMRAGKVTASRIADLMAEGRSGGASASRANYLAQLVVERLTGVVADSYNSPEMKWGTDNEPGAREAYEYQTGSFVSQVDFVDHPTIALCGASPDGLVGDDGLVEIKCPNTAQQIDALTTGKINSRYIKQMQWQMACTGRQWCDFASYDPRMPAEMRLFIKRVPRDDAMIEMIEKAVKDFLIDVRGTVAQLRNTYVHRDAADL